MTKRRLFLLAALALLASRPAPAEAEEKVDAVLARQTQGLRWLCPKRLRREYCGVYRLTPSIAYEIRCIGDGLEGRQTERPPVKLLAEAPDVLFVPGRPRYRYVIRRGADGKVTGFAQRREAWDLVWTRVAAPNP